MALTKVNVTAELITRATQRDSRHCMIAEALQLAKPEWRNIQVDLATIRWTNPRTRKRYIALTPEAPAAALVAFDQGEPIEPFSFNLDHIQATPLAEHTKDERGRKSKRQSRGRKTVTAAGKVEGGTPLPRGHLQGGPRVDDQDRSARNFEARQAAAPEAASNVTKTRRRYRQYGLRQLRA